MFYGIKSLMGGSALLAWALFFSTLFYFWISKDLKFSREFETATEKQGEVECFSTLRQFNFSVRVILIDIPTLQLMMRRCTHSITTKVRVAVDERDLENYTLVHPLIEIVPMVDDYLKDYWEFEDNITRIVPRFDLYSVGNVFFPANIPRFFEFWKRSRKMECKNLTMTRSTADSQQYIPLSGIDQITVFRDLLIGFGAFPFLSGGTLLGWYRECTIIPHTYDIDFSILATDYKTGLINYLKKLKYGKIVLDRILGVPSDGYELTVRVDGIFVDLFFVYHEGNTSWVGGLDTDLTKYKYTYPKLDSFCSADLLDRHFFVPCNVADLLNTEYGKDWMKDVASKRYLWNGSQFNVKKHGKFPEKMRKEVYQVYKKRGR